LKSAPIISKWNDLSTNQRAFIVFVDPNGAVRFDVSTNGNFSGANPAPPPRSSDAEITSAQHALLLNTWTHLAGTIDALMGALRLYVNGILQQEYIGTTPQVIGGNPVMQVIAPFATVFNASSQPLLIGAGDFGSQGVREFTTGLIDEPAIYGRAL